MIGVIILGTSFPRIMGDIGNEDSFTSKVIYQRIENAVVDRVVTVKDLDSDMRDEFIKAAQRLEQRGASVIGTSCGFLIPQQEIVNNAVNVPVMTSSLVLIPMLRILFGAACEIGVLTFDRETLSSEAYEEYLDERCQIIGLDKSGELYRCIKEDKTSLDRDVAEEEVAAMVSAGVSEYPEIELFLIECTNISPYKNSIRYRFGLPVFDLIDALEWVSVSS